jgi:hypothetical protein
VKSEACSIHKETINAYRILVEKPERKNHLGDIGIDGSIILKCMLQK